jgi:hypothetical protein
VLCCLFGGKYDARGLESAAEGVLNANHNEEED